MLYKAQFLGRAPFKRSVVQWAKIIKKKLQYILKLQMQVSLDLQYHF